jgi:hypothetical protein
MSPGYYNSHSITSGTSLITPINAKKTSESTRVLSTKVSSEDYGPDYLFDGVYLKG